MKKIILVLLLIVVFVCSVQAEFYKNIAGQKLTFYAWDKANNAPKTGDANNITVTYQLDGGTEAALTDTLATEVNSVTMPGIYVFDLEQEETNGDSAVYYAKTTTANIEIRPVICYPSAQYRLANVIQWNSENVPAANITGHPLVDVNYTRGEDPPGESDVIAWNILALESLWLDQLVAKPLTDDPCDDSLFAKLVSSSSTADWSEFDNTSSLMAISTQLADIDANLINVLGAVADANTAIMANIDDGVYAVDSNGAELATHEDIGGISVTISQDDANNIADTILQRQMPESPEQGTLPALLNRIKKLIQGKR